MKKQWIGVIVVLALVGLWAAKKIFHDKDASKNKTVITKLNGTNYWTCPMHPQIHATHAGECPICHMKLVPVKAEAAQSAQSHRAAIQPSEDQLELIGIQKQQVERMDLTVAIPISGRLLSPSKVAFQIYESDLIDVKPGLSFTGSSSLAEGGEISGTIASVDSIVDPTSRTVRVVGVIQQGPKALLAETPFSGVITVHLKNRVSIPESSVLHTGTGDLVYLFGDDHKLTPQKVKLGLKSEGFYEVLSGLEPGQFISSGPNFLIDSEAKIRGTSEPAPGETKPSTPACPTDQHWDTPMAMCMPGKG